MGDDEFVGGENGEEKRLVVFFRLRIWGGGREGFAWDLALWPAWWLVVVCFAFATVRCGRRGARR